MAKVIGQNELLNSVGKIVEIFKASECVIRPHFILTGPSGSGKTMIVQALAKKHEMGFIEINAAQLTKEGVSGNSLSKSLSPLLQTGNKPTIVFVDEFDKLFISGNSNDSCAHESTTGVQNEFLKVLEADTCSVFGDYGKYISVPAANILFVFAGAFNGEENINLDRLREMGVKTEFLGRVGLVYNVQPLSLDSLYEIVDNSELLQTYLNLFEGVREEDVKVILKNYLKSNYANNTLGARLINTLIHKYFIKGTLEESEKEQHSFKQKLQLN